MKSNKLLLSGVAAVAATVSVHAATFITPTGITSTTSATDLWSVNNLIEGPGLGYDAADPHLGITNDAGNGTRDDRNWVTAGNTNGADYFGGTALPTPVLTIDLGSDNLIGAINTWQYWHDSANQNSVSSFSLRFATEAEGNTGFGTSITLNPTFTPVYDNTTGASGSVRPVREQFVFSEIVNARFVEFTALDNFVGDPNAIAGAGDRVGLSEIAFEAIPEPSTGFLSSIAILSLLARRRR